MLNKIAENQKIKKPVIYGVSGLELTDEEKFFFEKNGPIGFIVFSRNIKDKDQIKKLTSSIKEIMDGEVLILIDQEGGRVARLNTESWKKYPSGDYFANLYNIDKNRAQKEIFENFQAIASDLQEIGINVNCAPVLDVLHDKTHHVIGDRAYGNEPESVSILGRKVCEGLLSKNVYPVIKHIPGHGLGTSDSHLELPIVEESLEELKNRDFVPFMNLNDQKFAMTAHILFTAIDSINCATTSKKAIDLIRNFIGFKNILMTDDLSMKALKGNFEQRTTDSLNAGCDLILHCNGNLVEMNQINQALRNKFISDELLEKLASN